jgi:flagellar biosynthetic protein FlhB
VLHGPVVNPEGRTDVVANQGEVDDLLASLGFSATRMVVVVLPMGVVLALMALAAGVLSGGWNFTWQPVSRTSPSSTRSGLGRVFSWHQLGETLKACLLALVLGTVGTLYLRANLPRTSPRAGHAAAAAWHAAGTPAGRVAAAGGRWPHLRAGGRAAAAVQMLLQRLKMSHQEMKKEMQGARRQRRGQGQDARAHARSRPAPHAGRGAAGRPRGDEPDPLCGGPAYDDKTMSAPRVVAKGADLIALRIRDLARESKVPVLQAPPLARALYAHTEVDQRDPAALFAAVAQVLAWVYQLRASMRGRRRRAGRPVRAARAAGTGPALQRRGS